MNLVDSLMRGAFDRPRDPRSAEYKAGARAMLEWMISARPLVCPYTAGCAEFGAFCAGLHEGRRIYLAHRSNGASDYSELRPALAFQQQTGPTL